MIPSNASVRLNPLHDRMLLQFRLLRQKAGLGHDATSMRFGIVGCTVTALIALKSRYN
jgi:hypothetical protein